MDDLISRQWLMECVNEGWIKFDTEKDENRFIHLVRDIAPSVQPEIEERMSETEQNVPNDDLISRKGAIDAIEAVFPVDPMKSEYAQGIACGAALSKTYIEQLPSAQPEIVRCKGCKFWREHKYAKYAKETKRYIPFCGLNAIYTKSDDFCSKGERRTDEQT